jgi:glycosyltransferase involved in cell wall biosynthesis
MRILIVTEVFLPSRNGLVTRLTQAIPYFQNEGHEVAVLAPYQGMKDYQGAPIFGITKFRLFRKMPQVFNSKKIEDYIDQFEPDVIHVTSPRLIGAAAAKYATEMHIPLVVSYHTNILHDLRNLSPEDKKTSKYLSWKLQERYCNNAAINLCTSGAMRSMLRQQGKADIHVLKRGVDSERFNPSYFSEDMRHLMNVGNESKKLLLCVGRLNKEKQLETLLPLMKRRDDICLAVAGDGPEKKHLERAFMDTSTVFLGNLDGRILSEAYASADAFVFPSTRDLVGITLLEAMASGLPIIAARSELTQEQFKGNGDVLFFQQGSEESLEAAIDALDDERLVRHMRIIGRRQAEASSWDDASQQLLDYYHIALTRASR